MSFYEHELIDEFDLFIFEIYILEIIYFTF